MNGLPRRSRERRRRLRPPGDWAGLTSSAYSARKADYQARLLGALARALPDAPGRVLHAEFASPRSFARYTRRSRGAVGGPPVSRWNSGPLAVGSDVLGPGLWVVGDSVFPGQGTMATVLSAIRVVERITGASWDEMRQQALRPREGSQGSAHPVVTLGVPPR